MTGPPSIRFLLTLLSPFLPRAFARRGGGDDVPTSIYRALMERIPQGAVVCTLEGEVLDANPRAAPLLKLEPAYLEGLPFPTALEEAGCPLPGDPFGRLREEAEAGRCLSLEPIPLKGGTTLRLGTFQVGGQCLVLGLLMGPGTEGEGPASTALDVFEEGAVLLGAAGKVLAANAAARKLLGREQDPAGLSLRDLVPEGNPAGIAGRLLASARSAGAWTGVLRVPEDHGGRRLALAARPLAPGDGRILVVLREETVSPEEGIGPALAWGALTRAFCELWDAVGREDPPDPPTILRDMGSVLDHDLACIERFHPERGQYELAAVDARAECRVQGGVLFPGAGSSSDRVRETGQPLLIPDLEQERRWDDLRLYREFGSGLKVPLASGRSFYGVLGLWSREKEYFGEEHLRGSRLVAAVLVAAEQAREIARLRRETEEEGKRGRLQAAALERIEEGVFSLDPEGRVLWANRAAERLTGRDRDSLRGTAVLDLLRVPPDAGLAARIGRGAWRGHADLLLQGGHSRPVRAGLTGTAGDFSRGAPILLVLADRTVSLTEEGMLGELARQVEAAGRLLETDLDAPDLAEFLARYAGALQHLVSFQEAQIYLPSDEGEALVLHAAANGSRARLERDLYFPRGESLLGDAASRGEAMIHPRLSDEEAPDAVGFQEEGFRSAAFFPLVGDGSGQGPYPVLALLSTREDAFQAEDVAALATLSGPMSRALRKLGPARRAAGEPDAL